jgi:hypothetical protein
MLFQGINLVFIGFFDVRLKQFARLIIGTLFNIADDRLMLVDHFLPASGFGKLQVLISGKVGGCSLVKLNCESFQVIQQAWNESWREVFDTAKVPPNPP